MTAARPTPPPPAKVALYDRLIATDPTLERKGATLPYTSINGKMFTGPRATSDAFKTIADSIIAHTPPKPRAPAHH